VKHQSLNQASFKNLMKGSFGSMQRGAKQRDDIKTNYGMSRQDSVDSTHNLSVNDSEEEQMRLINSKRKQIGQQKFERASLALQNTFKTRVVNTPGLSPKKISSPKKIISKTPRERVDSTHQNSNENNYSSRNSVRLVRGSNLKKNVSTFTIQ
jgi:hypothetical protein